MEGVREMNKGKLDTYKATLESFLDDYEKYFRLGFNARKSLGIELQRKVSLISGIVSLVHGAGRFKIDDSTVWNFYQQLGFTLQEDVSDYQYFDQIKSHVKRILNESIGNIETGMIPEKQTKPVLPIKDQILIKRCSDLLNAPDSFDRVINQATQVLEERIRNSVPYEKLCELIPLAKEQVGQPLVDKLLSPTNPVIVISDKQPERIAFYKMAIGIIAYLRNPSHHSLNDKTDWSLAWSVVGLIDSLLSELDHSYISGEKPKTKRKEKKK